MEYILSEEQCEHWVRCIDWSRLHHLDLSQHKGSVYLLEHLAGRVADLRELKITVARSDGPAFIKFVGAISGLDVLRLESQALLSILTTVLHGHSLQRMDLTPIGNMKSGVYE